MSLILASTSPRRKELLSLITTDFKVVGSDFDESTLTAADPRQTAENLAFGKCMVVAREYPEDTVIGCDTVVDCGGKVFGKPRDKEDARRMLKALSGSDHYVHTGVCVWHEGESHTFTATTRVENFSQAFGISGCESIAIFVAQNQGAKKYRRALSGFLRGSVMVVGIGFLFSLLLFFGGGQLVLPFLDGEAESAALGASYLRLMGCFYFLSFMGHSYVGHYRGIGRMNITFWGTTLQIAVRVVLTYALAGAMGLDAVALATGLGWVAIVLFHSTVFLLELKGIGFRLPTRDEDSQPG